ncbi:MAG: DUF2537 domain-containing protein [Pseudonocardiaceae bacterium]
MDRVGVELHVRRGRAVLVGVGDPPLDPEDLELPDDLAAALDEWARVAETVRDTRNGGAEPGTLVTRRGRQLAARLARRAGVPVGFADPMAGGVELFAPHPRDPGPTPWATGLTVTAAAATLVVVTMVVLAQALAETSPWLSAIATVLVAAGLAPSVWLGRRVPVWRWVAYGVAAGVVLSWLVLLLSLLG